MRHRRTCPPVVDSFRNSPQVTTFLRLCRQTWTNLCSSYIECHCIYNSRVPNNRCSKCLSNYYGFSSVKMVKLNLPTKLHQFIACIAFVVVQIFCQRFLNVRGAAYPIVFFICKAVLVPQIICRGYKI